MRLKDFQAESLKSIEDYLKVARSEGARAAFERDPGRGAYIIPQDWHDVLNP
jgi:hypothetical protein